MFKNMLSTLFMIGCLIGSAFSVYDCFISPAGNNSYPCTTIAECQSISQCLSNIFTYSNETELNVHLAAGVYTTNCGVQVSYPSLLTKLNIKAATDGAVTFDCNGYNKRHLGFDNVTALTVEINNINFYNGSDSDGGCIYASNIKNLTVQGSQFTNCHARTNGGAVYSNSSSSNFINSNFFDNSASIGGGALYVSGEEASGSSISNCQIKNNQAGLGAGVYLVGDYLSFTLSSVSLNSASTFGGGLYIISDTPTNKGTYNFLNSTFTNNSATLGGGLYAVNLNHEWNVVGALFEYNSASSTNGNATMDENVGCGDVTSSFCHACKAVDCTSQCAPNADQSCSSQNSTLSFCYGSPKFTACVDPSSCACAKAGLTLKVKIIIVIICVCLFVGVTLITVDVIRYFIRKRKTSSYTPI